MSDVRSSTYHRYEWNEQNLPTPADVERSIQMLCRRQADRTSKKLVNIYAKDQNIGLSMHEAYRKAISAAIDGAENYNEMIADIKSTHAVLTTSGNLRQAAYSFPRFVEYFSHT